MFFTFKEAIFCILPEEITSIIDYLLLLLAISLVITVFIRRIRIFVTAYRLITKFLKAIRAVNKQHVKDAKDPKLRERFYISKENDIKQKAWLKKIDDFVKAQEAKKSKTDQEKINQG